MTDSRSEIRGPGPSGAPGWWSRRVGPALLIALQLLGCTGATVGSGVGDSQLDRPPFYRGRWDAEARGPRVFVRLPISYQAGVTEPPEFEPGGGPGSPVHRLLIAMDTYLDSLSLPGLKGSVSPPGGTPPDVRFSCVRDEVEECLVDEDGSPPDRRWMELAVGRPSGDWTLGAGEAVAAVGADLLLVITLEIGQHWPRQVDRKGSKVVDLGTNHVVELPWLTALDSPISVLQFTGAVVGPDGKAALRIGAEGLLARRTSVLVSGFGAQALIGGEEIRELLGARFEDRPGRPLVWQEALRTLVTTLMGA